ncbi:MAG TPA: hypothetical protein PLV61_07135 [Parvularculaceae bacterium]|nr:hypothetical protein [Parvularculaceae bacterium]HRX38932.1 hypothetical protein [Parvularculaceae bacterium]
MDLDVQIIDGHPILQIPIKAIRFLDQQNAHSRMATQISHHFVEMRAATFFGRFNIDKFFSHADAVYRRVFA